MLIDWLKLISALILLWPPIALFHGTRVGYRAIMRDWDGYWSRTLMLGLHAIDFARAMLGAWLVALAVTVEPSAKGIIKYVPFMVAAAAFLPAVIAQTLVCKERGTAHAPFAFTAGLVLGYLPTLMMGQITPVAVASFALLLAAVISLGGNAPGAFFPMLALALLGCGVLFTQKKLLIPLSVLSATVLMPWLLTLLFPRHFVVSYLKRAMRPESESRRPKK